MPLLRHAPNRIEEQQCLPHSGDVVNPDDAAMLVEQTLGFFGYEAYRRMLRLAARRVFRQRMRPN